MRVRGSLHVSTGQRNNEHEWRSPVHGSFAGCKDDGGDEGEQSAASTRGRFSPEEPRRESPNGRYRNGLFMQSCACRFAGVALPIDMHRAFTLIELLVVISIVAQDIMPVWPNKAVQRSP
jgi:prepilin-type N-terminal cleavage/methylation domain-containing protein